jgi:Protein of unknown function (DUF4197)
MPFIQRLHRPAVRQMTQHLLASLFGTTLALFSSAAFALGEVDAATGIRAALDRGANVAIEKLGVSGGFLNNPSVHIPLPDSLRKARSVAKVLGMDKQFAELETSMNHAAELAVPQAKAVLVSAIKQMSVKDALSIVSGGEGSVTHYFRKTSAQTIHSKFLPIVSKATNKVGMKQRYDSLLAQGGKLGLVKDGQNLDSYVTNKAVDGLFLMIALEEKKIRQDPIGTGSAILKKVFGR